METKKDTFTFQKTVYLTDTNAEGNVYFAKYFDWQGMAREEFFRQNVPNHMEIIANGTRLITTNAWMVYHSECKLFDSIQIEVNTASLKRLSLELIFTFRNESTKALCGRGGERLAFANKDGHLIPIPDSIRENAQRFLIERATELTVRKLLQKRRAPFAYSP
jgi:acyl-CoA thioesterase FadM